MALAAVAQDGDLAASDNRKVSSFVVEKLGHGALTPCVSDAGQSLAENLRRAVGGSERGLNPDVQGCGRSVWPKV